MVLLVVAFGAIAYSFTAGGGGLTSLSTLADVEATGPEAVPAPVHVSEVSDSSDSSPDLASDQVDDLARLAALFDSAGRDVVDSSMPTAGTLTSGPLADLDAYIVGTVRSNDRFIYAIAFAGETTQVLSSSQLDELGYQMEPKGPCSLIITYDDSRSLLSCVVVAGR